VGVVSHRGHERPGTLLEQADAANLALLDNAPGGSTFATGILGRLDLHTGILAVVNAGHPAPLLIRDGAARPLELPANRPFGVLRHRPYQETQITLQPGDRLVMVTDGMLERGAAALDLATRVQDLAGLHRGKSFGSSPTSSSTWPDPPCPTTPACSCSTGTAATATPATRAPVPNHPARAHRSKAPTPQLVHRPTPR
jgi:hypothetical protein